ncbi:MAG: N,N-dimethylformamidase beta subunit family domain-containing protein [Frankiaceae bacterium]
MLRYLTRWAAIVSLLAIPACSAAGTGHAATTARGQRDRPSWSVRWENERPGTPSWQLSRVGAPHEIEGWADRTSVQPGERVGLHVSTTASGYVVHAIRVGWYGGIQGREVWRSATLPGSRRALPVPGPRHLVRTDWPVSVQVDTSGWPPGDYLFRLDASTGSQRFVPLQVRRPSAAGTVVIVSADTTWQAYNAYGGYSLYHGPDGQTADRAVAVSFDRPYGTETGQGASEYGQNMQPLVSLVERLGIEVDYVSDVDLDRDPHLLDGARAVVLTGHDEYWTLRMRAALLSARDRGTNLAFLGANSGYRHIRFEAAGTGARRVEVCYKVPELDPLYGRDNLDVTGQWRYPPDPRPESVLTGVSYRSNPVHADMIVIDPSAWLLAGTGARSGLRLPGVVAPEFDRVDLAEPTPHPIEIVTHSPLVVHGQPDFSDAAYYTVASGAGVFATGTIAWINSLAGVSGPAAAGFATAVTTNVLLAFAAGPAGRTHPAHDNTAVVYRHRAT